MTVVPLFDNRVGGGLPVETFDDFVVSLGDAVGLDLAGGQPDDLLVDLGFDSLAMFVLLDFFAIVGIDVPEELIDEINSLGDAYEHYRARLGDPTVTRSHDPLDGAHVRLRPAGASDLEIFAQWHQSGDRLTSNRLRGRVPSPESWHALMWERTLAVFAVVTTEGRTIGFVSAFEPDFRNSRVHLATITDPAWEGAGLIVEAALLVVDYLFAQFPLRKVCAEAIDVNYASFATGAGRLFEVEGVLRDHEYLDGDWHDVYLLAIHRAAAHA